MNKHNNKPTVRNAVFWNTASKFLQEGIRFVIAIILARLIAPSEFGIIAMVIVFISIGNRLTEGGFKAAIIKTSDLSATDCSTALMSNILLAIFFGLILWIVTPFIANFYDEPILELVVPVLALGLLFDATSIVQAGLFTKYLQFKEQAIAGLIAAIGTGVVGITMAFNGYGLWALVISSLVGKALNSAILWLLSNWRPNALPTISSFKKLFGYSSKIALSGLIENLSNNLLPLIIGKFYGAASLGFYNRANSFKEIPINNIYLITQPIIFSVLSSQQNNQSQYADTYRRTTRIMAFLVFAVMIFLIINAEKVVLALIGEKWLDSVIMLQILCVVGIFHQMMRINNDALISKGFAASALKQEIIRKVMYVITIIITFKYGLVIMLYGIAVQTFLSYIIMVIVTSKKVKLDALHQFKDAMPYLIVAVISAVPSIAIAMTTQINLYIYLIVSFVLYSFSYVILNRIFNLKALNDFVEQFLSNKIKNYKIIGKLFNLTKKRL
ncbi:lipopolysaccharide biosynthesis protein [Winogradskyella sediminis]|uniref:Membrane protein involved in the export of O-antigen and teichoic acid n=1 Tax=Winogradskyella sediminis TaxID=1382466 RepID=A0A1H1PU87_9FLAO|nr:lipopolysaccharide biosynthesis protein [Winogradskyella sediminis]SDS14911.1 Membrane protein involved in the export of O-antigen and teichoic acid [Winogradskyella sediminis]